MSQLQSTQKELELAYDDHEKIEKQLSRELKDIEKIEGLSTKSIFYKILGTREQQVEKERQEYLELSLKSEDTEKSIQLLEYEVNLLDAKVGSKTILEKKLEKLKLRREEEIISKDPKLSKQLINISTKLEHHYVLSKEIDEALEVANICHNLFEQTIMQLSKVKNWGQWPANQSRNRSRYRQSVRRDAIDRARNLSYQIKHHLNILDKELGDLGQRHGISLNPDDLSNFSAFFFNNLISDWILNQQLTQAIGAAAHTRDQIKTIVHHLDSEKKKTDTKILNLRSKREHILVS